MNMQFVGDLRFYILLGNISSTHYPDIFTSCDCVCLCNSAFYTIGNKNKSFNQLIGNAMSKYEGGYLEGSAATPCIFYGIMISASTNYYRTRSFYGFFKNFFVSICRIAE